jgi:predicted DNA-binding transcriptional regulator AlpA
MEHVMLEDQEDHAAPLSIEHIKPAYREVVEAVLLAVAGRTWELERAIAAPTTPAVRPSWHAEALYRSSLGQSLLLLADYAGGAFHPVSRVERAMKRVSRIVFGESLTNGYTLPARFHTTALGRLFHEVYARRYQPEELMSPAEVYRSLGIARQSLYDRIAEGTLTTVYLSGDLRLVRAEIDAWRAQRAQRRPTKKTAQHA